MTNASVEEQWMRRCLELAGQGAGRVSPNPMVGAVVVGLEGKVLGEGWHQAYGGPHAEVHAIDEAERRHGWEALRTATLFVNLEPCNHYGKTPPCVDLILEKGIPRVVVGMVDPFPAVSGSGIARLLNQGVEVTTGVLEKSCRRLNEAFVHHLKTGRPLVTLKVAQTLCGHVATTTGASRWITGVASRQQVHQLRATLDGVMVGSTTAARDNPRLTVRHVEGRQPVRIVLDRRGSLSPDQHLFTDEYASHTVAVVSHHTRPHYASSLEKAGGRVFYVPEREGHLDLKEVLERLGAEGGIAGRPLQSLLVEAGPGLSSALFQKDLVDCYLLFVAPKLLGHGIPALHGLGIEDLDQAITFAESSWQQVGEDLLFCGYRHAA